MMRTREMVGKSMGTLTVLWMKTILKFILPLTFFSVEPASTEELWAAATLIRGEWREFVYNPHNVSNSSFKEITMALVMVMEKLMGNAKCNVCRRSHTVHWTSQHRSTPTSHHLSLPPPITSAHASNRDGKVFDDDIRGYVDTRRYRYCSHLLSLNITF